MVYLHRLFLKMDFSFLPETNWVDIIVVIFLIRGGYIGLNRGLSVELFKTMGAIGSAVITLLYYERGGEWLAAHSFFTLQMANFLSFLALFFLLLIVFKGVRVLVFKTMHLELFGSLECWGGFGLGLARAIVFASLFIFVLTLMPIQYIKESVQMRSFSGPYLQEVAPKILGFFVQVKPETEGEVE